MDLRTENGLIFSHHEMSPSGSIEVINNGEEASMVTVSLSMIRPHVLICINSKALVVDILLVGKASLCCLA